MKLWITASIFALGLTILSSQAALKVMAIGDSMTEEYHFEALFFSAPDSDPTNANTMNWVEILEARRGTDITFGNYKGTLGGYFDWRNAGYKFNWGIPGYDTDMWMDIINASLSSLNVQIFPDSRSRDEMRDQYDEVDVIVIFLGGNDIRSQYGDLYNALSGDAVATAFINNVIENLDDIIDEIRDVNSTVLIILADVPDLGSTPDKIAAHTDPAKRANASVIINDLNAAVASLATSRGATLAPISNLTDSILSPDPLYIGALQMIKDKDPENPPLYLFCKGGLHPSTNGQAIIANTLLAAINTATSSSIPLLTDREIITELLGLNPDQSFIDWAKTAGLTDFSMTADIDGDGIPSLGEYLLNLNPLIPNDTHLAKVSETLSPATLILDYTPDMEASRLADITIKQSSDLDHWVDVPAPSLIDLGNGDYQARMAIGPDPGFFRMEFQLKP